MREVNTLNFNLERSRIITANNTNDLLYKFFTQYKTQFPDNDSNNLLKHDYTELINKIFYHNHTKFYNEHFFVFPDIQLALYEQAYIEEKATFHRSSNMNEFIKNYALLLNKLFDAGKYYSITKIQHEIDRRLLKSIFDTIDFKYDCQLDNKVLSVSYSLDRLINDLIKRLLEHFD